MIEHVVRFTIPAALSLLPTAMDSPAARAMLVSIGLQESRFLYRRQQNFGPARGFWQFEKAGVRGVMKHPASRGPAIDVLRALRYEHLIAPPSFQIADLHDAIGHNDTLACAFARLLLWTVPTTLPVRADSAGGWKQYLAGWNPGKPHVDTWAAFYSEAWNRVAFNSETRNA